MTEQEHAAALADEIEQHDKVAIYYAGDGAFLDSTDKDLIASALRAYARPAQAGLRDEIAKAIYSVSPWVYLDGNTVPWPDTRANYVYQEMAFKAADAVLSILPQTQELAIKNAVEAKLLEMRQAGEIFTLGQVNDLVEAAARFDVRAKAAENILRYEEE